MNRYELVTSILLVICLCLSYFDLCCWSFQLAALLTSASVLSNLVAIGVAAGFGCCRGSAERAENRLLPLAAEILHWPQWNDSAAWHCVLMTFYQSLRIQLKFDICTHKWSHLCRLHECMEYQAILHTAMWRYGQWLFVPGGEWNTNRCWQTAMKWAWIAPIKEILQTVSCKGSQGWFNTQEDLMPL